MAIAMSPTREQYPLSVKKVLKKTVVGTLLWLFLLIPVSIGLGALSLVESEAGGVLGILSLGALLLLAFIVIITYLYQQWYYNVYFYDLTADYIVIRKGPITPREITIPYERVQDVYVDQDLLDRIFGLYDVHLSSATISSGMEAHIDGLEKPAADGLRALLLQTVTQKISRHAPVAPPPPPPPPAPVPTAV